MWDYLSIHWARNFFNDWYAQAMASKLKPMQKAAKLLKRNLDNILTYCEHRVTNSMAEGINSKIMTTTRSREPREQGCGIYLALVAEVLGVDLFVEARQAVPLSNELRQQGPRRDDHRPRQREAVALDVGKVESRLQRERRFELSLKIDKALG